MARYQEKIKEAYLLIMGERKLQFPCIYRNNEYVDIDECQCCKSNTSCDIYATMLDEEYECKKDEGL